MFVLFNPVQSALALFMAGVRANHTNHSLAAIDLAIAANFLN